MTLYIFICSAIFKVLFAWLWICFVCFTVLLYQSIREKKEYTRNLIAVCILAGAITLCPSKQDMRTIIVLNQLDKYLEQHTSEVMDPNSISYAASYIETAIDDLYEKMGVDDEHCSKPSN